MTPPRPPHPDRPELTSIVTPDQPERDAVRHSAVDGAPQELPPHRKGTLPGGIGAVRPPAEPARTRRVPSPWAVTAMRPAPPSTVARMRPSEPPTASDSSPPQDAPQSLPEAQEAILRRELAEERAKTARLERDVRAEAEARQATYPPSVRTQSPVPSTTPAKVDQAIGASVRHLLAKAAPLLLAAAGIGGGATAVLKPSADPAKADAVLASQEAMRADVALLREQVAGMLKREAARDQYTVCLEEALEDMGSQLLPAQDRQGSAVPLRAWIRQRCQRLRP